MEAFKEKWVNSEIIDESIVCYVIIQAPQQFLELTHSYLEAYSLKD